MCPNPLGGFSECCHLEESWQPFPCQALQKVPLRANPWQRRRSPSEASKTEAGANDKCDEGPLDKKGARRGGWVEREQVAGGSLMGSRSGLSWWGGGDDKVGKDCEGPVGEGITRHLAAPAHPAGFSPTPGRPGPQTSKAEKRENRGRAEI